jgi:SNF2 family DNA or RNA helicase
MAEIIARSLKNSFLITGQTKHRQILLDQFKEDGKYLVMTNAGREGLNIQEANVVIMYDQDYTASGMEQRIGRAYRLGQQKRVRVYHLLVHGTIDFRIRKLLGRKKALADDLQDTIKELLRKEQNEKL